MIRYRINDEKKLKIKNMKKKQKNLLTKQVFLHIITNALREIPKCIRI